MRGLRILPVITIVFIAGAFMMSGDICYSLEVTEDISAEESQVVVTESVDSPLSYEELLEKYDTIKADRDNILIQTHRLLQFKRAHEDGLEDITALEGKAEELEVQNKDLTETIGIQAADIESLKLERKNLTEAQNKLFEEKAALEELTSESKSKEIIANLKKANKTSIKEIKDQAKSDIAKVEYVLETFKNEYSAAKKGLESAQKLLEKDIDGFRKSADQFEENLYEKDLLIADLSEEVSKLEFENETVLGQIKELKKENERIPSKFSKLAKHNRKLLKQLANLHYNQGQFYCERGDFRRAAKEFKQVIEMRPYDKDAIFNLGLIYAEHNVDRGKAIDLMKKYIQLDNTSTNAQWAKRYILQWEAWRREAKDVLR